MKKLSCHRSLKSLALLLALLALGFGCVPPGADVESTQSRGVPQVMLTASAGCPTMARLNISYSSDFGLVRQVDLYQSIQNQPYARIATFYYGVKYYEVKPLQNKVGYAYYVKARRYADGLWYSSPASRVVVDCSGSGSSSSSSSSSGSGSSSSSSSGGS
jgi:uncharacterized membrane protein YgcG